jgi:hypothetical protein
MFQQSKPDFQVFRVFRACPPDPVTVLGMDKLMWVGFSEPVPRFLGFQGFQSLSLIGANPEELAFRACLFAGTAWQLE